MTTRQPTPIRALTAQATDLSAAIDCFLTYCRAKNLSENTLTYYRYRLEAFRRYVEEHGSTTIPTEIGSGLIRDFIISETKIRSASTAHHDVVALRAFFNFLTREGLVRENPMRGVETVKRPRKLINTFTPEQVKAVLSTCRNDFVGIRDQAIVMLLYDTGMRAGELCSLKLEDVQATDNRIKVVGKGNKERMLSYGQATGLALARYLARRPQLPTNSLFVSCYGCPTNRHHIARIVRSRCRKAGITGVRCSPHTLRHSFAVQYLRNGGDAFTLQRLLGHADLTMTRVYCEVSETDALEKLRALSPGDRLNLSGAMVGRRRRIV